MKKPNGYWTKEKCKEEALKYNNRSDFAKKSLGAYTKSRRNGWLDNICVHMKYKLIPVSYWTKEKCKEEALKYDNITDFIKKSSGAYYSAIKNDFLDDITTHIEKKKKPNGFWNDYDKCKEEALKYENKTHFKKYGISAYKYATENGWLDEICSHMKVIGNSYKRCIYVYEFTDNHAYIGLTFNLKERDKKHLKKGTVYDYKIKCDLSPKLKQLTDYMNVNDAKEQEEYYLKLYKENGWSTLNKIKTGGLVGCKIHWTEERCKIEVLKYKNRTELRKNSKYVYEIILRNKWQYLLNHMTLHKKPIYWTEEKCKNEIYKYKTKKDFKKYSKSCYNSLYYHQYNNVIELFHQLI